MTVLTVKGLWKIVVGQIDRSNIGGPIQIAHGGGPAGQAKGWRRWPSSPRSSA